MGIDIIDLFLGNQLKPYIAEAADFIVPRRFRPKGLETIGDPEKGVVHYHCGIANSDTSSRQGGHSIYQALGSELAVQPHWLHDPSLLKGLSKVIHEKAPWDAPPLNWIDWPDTHSKEEVEAAVHYEMILLSDLAAEIRQEENPYLKQVHVAFSNGGYILHEALRRLPPEIRDTVIVITVGSTEIIGNDLACRAYNLIGEKDWAAIQANGGVDQLRQTSSRATIRCIPQGESQPIIGGHYMEHPDYLRAISQIILYEIAPQFEIL